MPDPSASTERRLVALVFATVFLDMIGFGIVLPLMPLYVAKLGGDATVAGWLFAGFSAMQILAAPVLGRLSDRRGRRPVVLLSLLGNALAMALFSAASELGWLMLLFVSRGVAGATAGNLAACQAILADALPAEQRPAALGKVGAAIGLGMMVGPALGGALYGLGGWAPPALAAFLALLDAVAVARWLPETHRPPGPDSGARPVSSKLPSLRQPMVLRVSAMAFLAFVSLATLQVTFALMVQARFGWGAAAVGLAFLLFGGISFLVQGVLLGRLVASLGSRKLAIVGPALAAAGLGLLAAAGTVPALLVGLGLLALGMAATLPSLSALASSATDADSQGVVLGVVQSAGGMGRVAGPLLAGALYTATAPGRPFLAGAVVSGFCLILALGLRERASQAARLRKVTTRCRGP